MTFMSVFDVGSEICFMRQQRRKNVIVVDKFQNLTNSLN